MTLTLTSVLLAASLSATSAADPVAALAEARRQLWAGELAAADATLDAALAATSQLDEERASLLVARSRVRAFIAFVASGDFAPANSDAQLALAALEPAAGPPSRQVLLRAEAHLQAGFAEYGATMLAANRDYATAARHFERALALAREAGALGAAGDAELHLGLVDERLGNSEQAAAHHRRALDLASAGAAPLVESYALRHLGFAARGRDDVAEAEHLLRRSLELRERLGFIVYLTFSEISLAEVLTERGAFDEARRRLDRAAAMARELAQPRAEALAALARGATELAASDREAATAAYRRAAEASARIGWRRGEELARDGLARSTAAE